MVTAVERIMGRRQIDQLIDDNGILIQFRRRPKIAVAGGGWRYGPEVTLKAQEVALIPFKRRMTVFLVNTELGDVPNLPYVLLGRHNLDIEEGDLFTHDGDEFKVETIDFKTEVRVAAHVDYFGKKDSA